MQAQILNDFLSILRYFIDWNFKFIQFYFLIYRILIKNYWHIFVCMPGEWMRDNFGYYLMYQSVKTDR
jgi:hypothetical protein